MNVFLVLLHIIILVSSAVQSTEGETRCENGSVQLTGGPNNYEGRVELCVDGRWVQVCENGGWSRRHVGAVCNQISKDAYVGGMVNGSYYSGDSIQTNFVNVITRCNPLIAFNNCVGEVHDEGCDNHFAAAACPASCVDQSARLSLVLPDKASQGLVEICYQGGENSFWSGVCFEDMTVAAATVICRQLEHLQKYLTVNISRSQYTYRYTYSTVDCKGNESLISNCSLIGVEREARCNAAIVNCQVSFDDYETTSTEEEVTSAENGDTAETPTRASTQDMLTIITAAVCGFIILLLLIIVIMLIIILLKRSRNRTRLKVAGPTIVNISEWQSSSTVAGGGSTNISPTLNNPVPHSLNGSLQPLTNHDQPPYYMYYSHSSDDVTTAHLTFGYPTFNSSQPPPAGSSTNFPHSQNFLVPEMVDPDTHIYDEPKEPLTRDPRGHDYAELEQTVHCYQNDVPAPPFPYEMPLSAQSSRNNTMRQHSVVGVGVLSQTVARQQRQPDGEADYHEYTELDNVVTMPLQTT